MTIQELVGLFREGGTIAIAILEALAIITLWKTLREDRKDSAASLLASQEGRIEDAKEQTTAILGLTKIVERLERTVDDMERG